MIIITIVSSVMKRHGPSFFNRSQTIYKLTRILETNRPIRETPRHDRGTHTERFNFIRPSPCPTSKAFAFYMTRNGAASHYVFLSAAFTTRSNGTAGISIECLENLRERGGGERKRGVCLVAFIRKNGVTSGFEWLRKLPWYRQ